jgi:hypothetical protein
MVMFFFVSSLLMALAIMHRLPARKWRALRNGIQNLEFGMTQGQLPKSTDDGRLSDPCRPSNHPLCSDSFARELKMLTTLTTLNLARNARTASRQMKAALFYSYLSLSRASCGSWYRYCTVDTSSRSKRDNDKTFKVQFRVGEDDTVVKGSRSIIMDLKSEE